MTYMLDHFGDNNNINNVDISGNNLGAGGDGDMLLSSIMDDPAILAGIDPDTLTTTDQLVIHADNERAAPEILPYPGDLLDRVQAELARRTDAIRSMREAAMNAPKRHAQEAEAALLGIPADDGVNDSDGKPADGGAHLFVQGVGSGIPLSSTLPFRIEDLLNLELTRVKYAVADLIRVRLQKIQFFRASIVAEPQKFEGLLSPNEFTLVQQLHEIFEGAMMAGGIGQLPSRFQVTPSAALPKAENGFVYVLGTALEDCEVALAGMDIPQHLKSGSSILCPYSSVRAFVLDGKMKLMC